MHDLITDIHRQLNQLISQGPKQGPCAVMPLVIGFSGGIDSTVLLQAVCQLPGVNPAHIHAVYIHHGLSAHADAWQQHCQQQCSKLGCTFAAIAVTVSQQSRTSTEASARTERYAALFEYCRTQNGVLVLGQHRDDQLETFLLQAQRGAGPKGLAAMPALIQRQSVWMLRPLLKYERNQLEQCAHELRFSWVEDDSNQNMQFERNFVRQQITPLLRKRWPAISRTIARSAQLCARQNALLEEVCDERLQSLLVNNDEPLATENVRYVIREPGISLLKLADYSIAWQEQLVRRWLENQHKSMPDAKQLSEILKLAGSAMDAQPLIKLGSNELRCFQNTIYVVNTLPAAPVEPRLLKAGEHFDEKWSIGSFVCNRDVQVRGNMPAISCRMYTDGVSKKLKDWFKQWQIPAWRRRHIPVIFNNENVVAAVLPEQIVYFAGDSVGLEIKLKNR